MHLPWPLHFTHVYSKDTHYSSTLIHLPEFYLLQALLQASGKIKKPPRKKSAKPPVESKESDTKDKENDKDKAKSPEAPDQVIDEFFKVIIEHSLVMLT